MGLDMVIVLNHFPTMIWTSFRLQRISPTRRLSLKVPLKLSQKPVSQGLSGSIYADFTPIPDNQLRSSLAINSGLLSPRMYFGIPWMIMALANCSITWTDPIPLAQKMVKNFLLNSSIRLSMRILPP